MQSDGSGLVESFNIDHEEVHKKAHVAEFLARGVKEWYHDIKGVGKHIALSPMSLYSLLNKDNLLQNLRTLWV